MELQIGSNIRKLRIQRSMTQREVANSLSVTVQAVSKWEQGRSYPDLLLLLPIANMFSVTLDELFGNTH
ncbi:MAG: helix-turn-helix transcriptional regulator [Clostridia bacterium]|jgi:transcriptional regulator with XRE-family HTH domain|nr:helix-turn-helix transcriptional regulator [Clostridia bacterium]MBQ1255385.1 helix-turn-helix transcriptional regulator [Clostridia bacterium]MBQ2254918.1 helix-turn-helix transcriptional regulator [Clostridia bacterium]